MKTLWPASLTNCSHEQHKALARRLLPEFMQLLVAEKISPDEAMLACFNDCYLPFADWLAGKHQNQTMVIGINGAQGSGKSTLTYILSMLLAKGYAKNVARLSIDDLYKTRQQRQKMADDIHPLFITRGVPGTHDVEMGIGLLADLKSSQSRQEVWIPRFNKATDDRYEKESWDKVQTPVDIILFEGWCVGSIAEDELSLKHPVNWLEEHEDVDGAWRRYVNEQLSGPYRQLFAAIDILVMLEIPGMESVFKWRMLQEQKRASENTTGHSMMSSKAMDRFIMHFERLTRASLREMPSRADVVLKLNKGHQITDIVSNLS